MWKCFCFCGKRETEEPRENPQTIHGENQQQTLHQAGLEPKPHWREVITLTTAPFRPSPLSWRCVSFATDVIYRVVSNEQLIGPHCICMFRCIFSTVLKKKKKKKKKGKLTLRTWLRNFLKKWNLKIKRKTMVTNPMKKKCIKLLVVIVASGIAHQINKRTSK